MLVFRHYMTVSLSVVLTLAYGAATTAQELPSLNESQSNQSLSNLEPVSTKDSPLPKPESLTNSTSVQNAIILDVDTSATPETIPSSPVLLETEKSPEDALNESLKTKIGQSPSEAQPDNNQPVVPPASESSPNTSPSPYQPAPEDLNPSGNQLLFPTAPSEVEINRVQAVTLNQAIELALRNNKDLLQARITLERRRAELDEAQSALFPTLSTGVQFSRDSSLGAQQQNEAIRQGDNTQQFIDPTTGQVTEQDISRSEVDEESTNLSGDIELSYNVYTGGRRSADIDRAEREIRRSELEVERISEQTRFDATDNYYLLQNADAQVAIEQASVEDATQSLRDARLLEQAGLGTRFDVLRAEVELATAAQRLTSAIAEQRRTRRQLAETLSLGQQVELTAADEIGAAGSWQYTLDQSIILAYKNRAELEQELLQREIAENQRQIALADIKPQVSLFARYEYANNFDDSISIADGYSFGTRLQWTIFDGGRAFARAEESNRDIDLANTRFADQRNQIRFQVESAYFDLISNQENIETTRLNVERAEEALRLARLRFQAGVGTQTDVIESQRDLTQARSSYLQAIIQYNQALNRLQRSVTNLPDNRLFEQR